MTQNIIVGGLLVLGATMFLVEFYSLATDRDLK